MTPAQTFVKNLYAKYQGRAPLMVGLTHGFGAVYPFVFEDESGVPIGLIGCAWNQGSETDFVQIYHFSSFRPRNGAGTKMMDYLCAEADRVVIRLYVQAEPRWTEGEDEPLDKESLIRWYKKFGFKGNGALTRLPVAA
ncbi:MAG: hypothetical protein KJ958_04525 [Gammaproteobacteria bacterium]|nr:hypothetical protein [Gammaproteobacteria bacterium]MBU1978418.1 hypothetical protein [Gammaproteobacteria bacterium]